MLLLIGGIAGCGMNGAAELRGKWVGVPDTAAAKAQREADRYRALTDTAASDAAPAETADRPAVVSDWEQHDVRVELEFIDAAQVRLALSGDATGQPVQGTWKVLEKGPAGMVIEIVTPAAGEEGEATRRRFELGFDRREDGLVGFTFNEVGADRRLGSLYFQRPQ